MILISQENLSNAIKKARSYRPRVKFIGFRTYQVESRTHSGVAYTVRFSVNAQTQAKQGHCTCKAGQAAVACWHLAAAVAVHHAVQAVRVAARESKRVADMVSLNPS